MESRDPDKPAVPDEPAHEPPSSEREAFTDEALHRLEERLDRASETAERLIAEAASRASRRPPPSGWQQPQDATAAEGGASELELLSQLLHSLRDLIPPELQRRLAEALRELLLALRALIDWYLERTARRSARSTEVQDIPIS